MEASFSEQPPGGLSFRRAQAQDRPRLADEATRTFFRTHGDAEENEDLELVPAAWDGNLALLVDTVRDRFLLWLGTGHCTKQARRAGLQLVRQ